MQGLALEVEVELLFHYLRCVIIMSRRTVGRGYDHMECWVI